MCQGVVSYCLHHLNDKYYIIELCGFNFEDLCRKCLNVLF